MIRLVLAIALAIGASTLLFSAVPADAPARTAALQAAAPDSILEAARRFMAAGQPWQASRLLAPVVADTRQRTPARVLLAARAASAWGGASQTVRLLTDARWLDQEEHGDGHALLAAAFLAQRQDTLAREAARAAVRTANTPVLRAEREVLLARALDRLNQRDSAALVYRAAAAGLPTIADWLVLRAIGVTDDSTARRGLAELVLGASARSRVPWMEAQALERTGDSAAAARAYTAAGGKLKALALRQAAPEARDSVRRVVVSLLSGRLSGDDARAAVALLEQAGKVSPAEQLLVARVLARAGDGAGAAKAYAAAVAGKAVKVADRLAYADLLVRLGRNADAIKVYKPLTTHPKLGATAMYGMARAHVRAGEATKGQQFLRQIPVRWSRDTVPAAKALYLLGDLATDARDDTDAIRRWTQLAARYPTSPLAPSARFRTGIARYAAADIAGAAGTFDSLARRYSSSSEVQAARYWAGRAYALLGDTAQAGARWRSVIAADQRSWYAGLSEVRLGIAPWSPPAAADHFIAVPSVDSALVNARLLDRLGMGPEARREVDAVVDAAGTSVDLERLLAVSDALRGAGYGRESILVARRAEAKQRDPDARTWRLLYPLVFADALNAEATLRGIDPTFAAALIRQESLYLPGVTSPAGARGLMQLMPEVGRLTARSLRYPQWDVALLWQPDVNLELGMTHLAELLKRYGEPVRVLAAYNAGGSRVDRWALKAGVEDAELFAERIPYVETRGYVRVIQRNQQFYRALYAWPERALQP